MVKKGKRQGQVGTSKLCYSFGLVARSENNEFVLERVTLRNCFSKF